jgi:vacuolar-type H+-ATPase subunit I/STV1
MGALIFRFIVGGLVVSVFAILGDLLKPRSFAGLFGAAPSVGVATLGLTILTEGKPYASVESRSMIIGAAAFFIYLCLCIRLLVRYQWSAKAASVFSLSLWFAAALGLWFFILK